MKKEGLVALIIFLFLGALSLFLGICGTSQGVAKPPIVDIWASPISAISPADFSVSVSITSENPVELVLIYLDNMTIYSLQPERDEDRVDYNIFNASISGEQRYITINFQYTITYAAEIAKIFSFKVFAESRGGGSSEKKADVIVYRNNQCSVRIYLVSGQDIQLPPLTVRLGADVNDDRCGNFNHTMNTTCNFRFLWDADNVGGEFKEDGETNQPIFEWTYTEIGIYTPRVKVIDDGGNICESQNIIPIYAMRKLEKISPPLNEGFLISGYSAAFKDGITRIFVANATLGVFDYSFYDGRFTLNDIRRFDDTTRGVKVKGDYLIYKAPTRVYLFNITEKVRWDSPTRIDRIYDDVDLVLFPGRATFIIFLLRGEEKSFIFSCPFPAFSGDICFSFELQYKFSHPYEIFTSQDSVFLIHFISDTNYSIALYSFPITLDPVYGIWVMKEHNREVKFSVDYLPWRISVFYENGVSWTAISTRKGGAGARTYIFNISECINGNCTPIRNTNIRMKDVVMDIEETEICAITEGSENYKINIFDLFIPDNLSLCGNYTCILASLCLDTDSVKCKRGGIYPFIFSGINGGYLARNLATNCIPLDFYSQIVFARDRNIILENNKYMLSYSMESGKLSFQDAEFMLVDLDESRAPNLGGYLDLEKNAIYLSVAGVGGVEVFRFDLDGKFELEKHIYVRPEGKFADNSYEVIKHFYDGDILISILQKDGCGEEWNFSGIFLYEEEGMKTRKPSHYISYHELGIHSVSNSFVKKIGTNKYLIIISGSRCQESRYDIITLLFDLGTKKVERLGRFEVDQSPVSFEVLRWVNEGDFLFAFSVPNALYTIAKDGIKRIREDIGGFLKVHKGMLYNTAIVGNRLTIKSFDLNFNLIKEFSFYLGIVPSLSDVVISEVNDEFFGTGGTLDFILLGLSYPTPYSPISSFIALDITDFVRNGGDMKLFGITPNIGMGTKDIIFFRSGRNIIFFVDTVGRLHLASL